VDFDTIENAHMAAANLHGAEVDSFTLTVQEVKDLPQTFPFPSRPPYFSLADLRSQTQDEQGSNSSKDRKSRQDKDSDRDGNRDKKKERGHRERRSHREVMMDVDTFGDYKRCMAGPPPHMALAFYPPPPFGPSHRFVAPPFAAAAASEFERESRRDRKRDRRESSRDRSDRKSHKSSHRSRD